MLFELVAGFDSELAERLAQVVLDRVAADEQLSGDVLVRGALDGEAGDLCFLWGQVVACFDAPFAGVLTGRLELYPRALGERIHPELGEHPMGDA